MPVFWRYKRPLTCVAKGRQRARREARARRTHLDEVGRDVLAQELHQPVASDVLVDDLVRQHDVVQLCGEFLSEVGESAVLACGLAQVNTPSRTTRKCETEC